MWSPAVVGAGWGWVHLEEVVVHVEGVARDEERKDDEENHDGEHQKKSEMPATKKKKQNGELAK